MKRRTLLTAASLVPPAMATAACGNSSMSGSSGKGSQRIKIGLLVALTGVYQSVGNDMKNGFQLYLNTHGGKLGGLPVDVSIADEGDGSIAHASAEKLIKQDNVQAITGIVGVPAMNACKVLADQYKLPIVGANARAGKMNNLDWIWLSSYISNEPGLAMGAYVKSVADGPVYVMGPEYAGGHDEVEGFIQSFTQAGGKLANPGGKAVYTPYPNTPNFQPYLAALDRAQPKAVYVFYAGGLAVGFVKQFRQFLGNKYPLYAAGFLVEGSVLAAEGNAALGIKNSLNYAADLDNPANRTFVAAYQQAYNTLPTCFSMAAYDAGAVLDRAIGAAAAGGKTVTSSAINDAIGKVGQIDSPRGPWQFSPTSQSPVQKWYLREVRNDGRTLSNAMVSELLTLGG